MDTPVAVRIMLRRVRRIRQRIRKFAAYAGPHWIFTHSFACPVCHDGGVCPVALEVWRAIRFREEQWRHISAVEQRRREADPEYRRVLGMFERAAIRQGSGRIKCTVGLSSFEVYALPKGDSPA
jgi:hypothetical protein